MILWLLIAATHAADVTPEESGSEEEESESEEVLPARRATKSSGGQVIKSISVSTGTIS